jgi:hypothetical protein
MNFPVEAMAGDLTPLPTATLVAPAHSLILHPAALHTPAHGVCLLLLFCSLMLLVSTDLPEEHRQAFLGQLEHMQVRDRCAVCTAAGAGAAGGGRAGQIVSLAAAWRAHTRCRRLCADDTLCCLSPAAADHRQLLPCPPNTKKSV